MYSMNIEIHFFPKPFKLEFSVFCAYSKNT